MLLKFYYVNSKRFAQKIIFPNIVLNRCTLYIKLVVSLNLIFVFFLFQRFTTFITVSLSLFVGLVILGEYIVSSEMIAVDRSILKSLTTTNYSISVTRLGSGWHVASTEIVAPYKAFSREKIPAKIGANIGLMHINITLNGNYCAKKIFFSFYLKITQCNALSAGQ